jgi:hypothetical protein
MFASDDMTAELPAPRDDEPESLRRDIVDELRDHLQCAFHRELHLSRGCTSADEARNGAEQRVLTRFGNPAAVARRLWWDALKEKIMSQRITAVMAGIAAAACVAGCLLLWQMVQQGQAAQAAQQELTARLLEQIAQLASRESNGTIDPRLAGWANVSLRLVAAADDTRPVQGNARITGGPIGTDTSTASQINKQAATDASGRIDLGTVPLGKYMLTITSDGANAKYWEEIIIGPEGFENVVISCPDTRPEPAALSFEFPDLPESLRDVLFLVSIGSEADRIGGRAWQREDAYHSLLVNGEGQVLGRQKDREEEYAIEYGVSSRGSPGGFGGGGQRHQQSDGSGAVYQIDRQTEIRAYTYGVTEVRVLAPRQPEQVAEATEIDTVRLADLQYEWKPDMRPEPGQSNVWKIAFPAQVIERAAASRIAFGLRPVPPGMAVVQITPESTGPYEPGTRVDVNVTYVLADSSDSPPEELTQMLLRDVELFSPATRIMRSGFPGWGESSRAGFPGSMEMALLVTPEQAAAVELAKTKSLLSLTPHAGDAGGESAGAMPDPALLEELQRAQPPDRRSRSRGFRPAFGGGGRE